MMFTLPANINYISSSLQANNIYLLDPVPPYDPYRHADTPPYQNPHGGGQISAAAAQRAQAMLAGAGHYGNFVSQERINQVEVQRRQVDEVYTTIETGGELEQSDPGPLIKTELFPHQRKALTFLLQREQDWSSLKKARKYFDKATKKKLKNLNKAKEKGKAKDKDNQTNGEAKEGEAKDEEDKDGEAKAGDDENKDVDGDGHEDTKESTPAADEEDKGKARDISRSLWEPNKDDKGRIKMWKNKITAEEIKVKKGDKPPDCKGAILADDVSLTYRFHDDS
jgi:SWI/SNF-related matrix-associated actin-dependent regulator of chromatin subfamily A3